MGGKQRGTRLTGDFEISYREEIAEVEAILDRRRLQSLGVLLPVRLHAFSFLPGRHPLGRAGDGMRFLRTRPFESGQDNPRDIDKFSPPDKLLITEWESEVQATIRVFGDVSGSMSFGPKAAVRNLALLQLTYSLWRASDRVRTVLFSAEETEELAERNLKSQLETLTDRLSRNPLLPGQDAFDTLEMISDDTKAVKDDLVFMISDYCPVSMRGNLKMPQEWRSMLRRLSCEVVQVIISFELSREQRGAIKLWDPERQNQRLTLLTPSRIDRINEQEGQRVADLEKLFRGLGQDCLTLRRERDVYPSLARLARFRRRRRM
jgi:uncharacterized protein (DUF58 family)